MTKNLFLLLVLFSFTLFARAPKEYSIARSEVKLQTEGISFKPFRDMQPKQIKPLESRTYTITRGSEVSKREVYDMNSLWLRDNKIATYKNPLITLEFYKLAYLPPKGLEVIDGTWVKEAAYKQAVNQVDEWDPEQSLAWLKHVNGQAGKLEDRYPKLNYSIKTMFVEYGQKPSEFDFLLTSKDNRKYFVKIKMRGGEEKDAKKAMQSFMRYIKIEKIKEAKKSKFQSSKFKPKGKVSPEYQKTIDEVKKQVLNTKGWWFAQTNNYILKSNMEIKKRSFAKKVQTHVEFIRSVYEKFIPPIDEIKAVSIIAIPGTRQEYVTYTQAPDWSAGVWMPDRKELAVSSHTSNEKSLLTVLRHEAFHQYIFYALNENESPAWYNEGHADLFSSIKKSGSKVALIEDQYYLRTLLPLFKRRGISLTKHINLDYDDFYANKDLNYPLSWSLIYFLRKAVPLYKDKRYSKVLSNALEAIATGASFEEINKKAFYGIDMEQFEDDFFKFWNDKRMRSKASRNFIVPKK